MSVQSSTSVIPGPSKYVATAMVARDNYIVSSWDNGGNNTLLVWKKSSSGFDLHQQIMSPHKNTIKGLAIDGKWLASISQDKTAKVWKQNEIGNFEEHQSFSVKVKDPEALLTHFDFSVKLLNGFLFAGHYGCEIWKFNKNEQFEKFQELLQYKELSSLGVNKDFFWVGCTNFKIYIFKKFANETYKKIQSVKHYSSVKFFVFNNNYVAAGSWNSSVNIWCENAKGTFNFVHRLSLNYSVSCLAFKVDTLVIGLFSGEIQIRKKEKGEFPLKDVLKHETTPSACVIFGDQLLISVNDSVKVWDFSQSKQEIANLPA